MKGGKMRRGCVLIGLLVGLCSFPWAGLAESARLVATSVHIPERGNVTGYILATSKSRLAFCPPPGWRIRGNLEANEVIFVSPNFGATITCQLLKEKLPATALELDALRKGLARAFPEGREVGPCYTAAGEGLIIDLFPVGGKAPSIATRLGWAPAGTALVEFRLTASPGELAKLHFTFTNFLGSFREERPPE